MPDVTIHTDPVVPIIMGECPTCEKDTQVCCNCQNCEKDCMCWYCVSHADVHDGRSINQCGTCFKCEDKCECGYCERCGNVTQTTCDSCEYCNNCCVCGDLFFKNPVTFHESTSFKLNKSKRFISVEIEVADFDGNKIVKAVDKWKGSIVEDGSVDGNNPFEINTSPANGDLFLKQIDEICKVLSENDGAANSSCGLHVHVDARSDNFFYIKKLSYLYEKIEDALFSIVAPSRKNSHYSRPCGKKYVKNLEANTVPKDVEKAILKNMYNQDNVNLLDKKDNKYDESRYNALNLHSWIYRGTVECRMHHGTINATKIKNWGMLWASILDYAENNPESYLKNLKGDGLSILLSVCPNDSLREWVVERHAKFKNGRSSDAD